MQSNDVQVVELTGNLTRFDSDTFNNFDLDKPRADVVLSGLGKVDTAGIAFLLKQQQVAKQQGKTIRYLDASDKLLRLAAVYGISEQLGFELNES